MSIAASFGPPVSGIYYMVRDFNLMLIHLPDINSIDVSYCEIKALSCA